jgi:glycosyltransferase involved in cell wall biosynthesis
VNVLLISPNGLQELSGGGLYVRSLVQALCGASAVSQLTVLSKQMPNADVYQPPSHCRAVYLKKNVLRDVAARAALCPTYLQTYRGLLARHAADADVVMFHNSRCGRLMTDMRGAMPGKTFAVLSDNVEAELQRQHRGGNALQKLTAAIDTWLIQRSEAPCQHADFMTFITEADRILFQRLYGLPPRTGVLPISLPRGEVPLQRTATPHPVRKVLFTAHFGFAPNRTALAHFAETAALFRTMPTTAGQGAMPVEFVVAGAKAAEMAAPYPHLHVVDGPDGDEMAATFASADVYLAPVSWGSGMKTKVAEALSYGIPVICLPNAAVGYEAALSDNQYRRAICVVDSISSMANEVHRILQSSNAEALRRAAFEAFDALYSQASQTRRFEKLLCPQ